MKMDDLIAARLLEGANSIEVCLITSSSSLGVKLRLRSIFMHYHLDMPNNMELIDYWKGGGGLTK